VTHGEDATVQLDQSARANAFPNQVPSQAQLEKLTSSDNAMLPLGQ
jgi:hypothetical protein